MRISDWSSDVCSSDLLKADSGYYNYSKRTVGDFFRDLGEKGISATLRDRLDWGEMRMDPTDLADVTGYTFLVNGKSAEANWTGIFKPGERVRLRSINASRSEEHKSELQSLMRISYAAFCLRKKTTQLN